MVRCIYQPALPNEGQAEAGEEEENGEMSMIRAKVGEKVLAMGFAHTQVLDGGPLRGATRCTLYQEDAGEGAEKPILIEIGQGDAFCAVQDNFCKETGRKVALERALEAAFPGGEGRETRKALWGAYRGRK